MPKLPRLWGWTIAAIALAAMIIQLSPQQGPVMLYKLALTVIAAPLSYWIDRGLFKLAPQPRITEDMPRDLVSATRMIARALIYFATVLGLTLGL